VAARLLHLPELPEHPSSARTGARAGPTAKDSVLQVVALSRLLNELPIHRIRPDVDRFRNPNGLALKRHRAREIFGGFLAPF
jgi:hypothetical protein